MPMPLRFAIVALSLLGVQAARAGGAVALDRDPGERESVETTLLQWSDASTVTTLWQSPRPVSASGLMSPADRGDGPACSSYLSLNADPDGDMPREVAFTPDGTTALVVNRDTDNLAFFDVASRTITSMVPVGDFPVYVAVSPNGKYALTANVLSNSVSIVDVPARTLAANVPITGAQPYRAAIASDSGRAFVGVINDAMSSSFSVVDLGLLAEVMTFPSTPQGVFGGFFTPESAIFGNTFTQFALTPDDLLIVLPNRDGGVSLYDAATGELAASLATPTVATAVAVSADSSVAVVSHEGSVRRITKIDLINRAVSGTLSTAANLSNQLIRITPDGSHAIAAVNANTVIFVDLASGVTDASLSTGAVGDIEFSFDGQFAFVSSNNARVIDLATRTIVRTLTLAPCVEAATSPVDFRAVALNNRFREDILVYNINGASGFVEGSALSGPPPEGDATRTLALSADGLTVVAANLTSRNIGIVDLDAERVLAHVDVGDRPLDVAITPDGAYALAANATSNTLSVVDLTLRAEVANLAVPDGPARVAIAPDGQTAYVMSISGTDRLYFVYLAGAASGVVDSVPIGQAGSTLQYTYGETSGMTLSPDGSTLALCISFDNQLLLVDTATHGEIARVPVGNFPIRAVFSPDGSRAYVANSAGNDVSVVRINGAMSAVEAVIPGIFAPLTIDFDATGSFAYIGSFDAISPTIRIIDASNNTAIGSIPLEGAPRATHLSPASSILYIAAFDPNRLIRVSASGVASAVIDSAPLSESPSSMVFSESLRKAAIAQPAPDGLDLVRYRTLGDINGDCAVELPDFASFFACYGGPGVSPNPMPPLTPQQCLSVFDFDGDADVDLVDLGKFQAAFDAS